MASGFTRRRVVKDDPRYTEDAYIFLREALDFTVRDLEEGNPLDDSELEPEPREEGRHVSGGELLDGFRDYCLQEFGPMAITVLHEWGITESLDIGNMVFNLIRVGSFKKAETDSIEDFRERYSFHDAFVAPFLPRKTIAASSGFVQVPLFR